MGKVRVLFKINLVHTGPEVKVELPGSTLDKIECVMTYGEHKLWISYPNRACLDKEVNNNHQITLNMINTWVNDHVSNWRIDSYSVEAIFEMVDGCREDILKDPDIVYTDSD